MVSEIKGPGPGVISALEQANTQVESTQKAAPRQTVAPQDAGVVELTPTAERLQALTRSVANVPEVDSAAVAQYRQQIADGSFSIEPDAIADKFARFEADLRGRG